MFPGRKEDEDIGDVTTRKDPYGAGYYADAMEVRKKSCYTL